MASNDSARDKLLRFLDQTAFDPILRAKPDKYSDADRRVLADVQRRTESEKKRYHDDYGSAREIRDRFMQDVHSSAAKKVNDELKRLGLPRLPDLQDEFLKLCEEIGVAKGA
jgi:hypothetical protein